MGCGGRGERCESISTEWKYRGGANAREADAKLRQLPTVDLDRATRADALEQRHNLGRADAFAAELAIECGACLPQIQNSQNSGRRCRSTRSRGTKKRKRTPLTLCRVSTWYSLAAMRCSRPRQACLPLDA